MKAKKTPRLITLLGRPTRRAFSGVMALLAIVIFVPLRLLDVDIGLATALALGVPSFVFAAIQFNVGNGTVAKLIDLQHQMSTRRLDEAPHFMDDIVDLLGKPGGEILIFCDFPAYGAISNPDEYKSYLRKVCERSEDETVKMISLDDEPRQKLAAESYRDAPTAKRKAGYRTEASYLEAVREKNFEAEETQFAHVERHKTSLVMPLYFWVVGREAIFSLRRYAGDRMVEVGFKTSDRPLIDAFRDIFNRYLEVDEKYERVKKEGEGAVGEPGARNPGASATKATGAT
jgi:hypothetical protein